MEGINSEALHEGFGINLSVECQNIAGITASIEQLEELDGNAMLTTLGLVLFVGAIHLNVESFAGWIRAQFEHSSVSSDA